MFTHIIKADEGNIAPSELELLGRIINSGGLVAFPTETVYGLGANALDDAAVKKIYAAKGRPSDNPLIVHFADAEDIGMAVREIPDSARLLLSRFAPGPLTVIMKKSDRLAQTVTAGLDTVAVRIPSDKTARAFIKAAGVPIAAPSANISGKPSPTSARHVIADMNGKIDAIIDGADCEVGVESTIIDLSSEIPVILRPGGITYNQIKELLPDAVIDSHVLSATAVNGNPKCPGMKYRHYAPDADVTVVEGSLSAVRRKISELLRENSGKKTGVLAYESAEYHAASVIYSGSDNRTYAKNLFRELREFDEKGIETVYAEFVYDDDYGLAVKNRLYKAAGNKVIYV